jgi:teichuronic acid biosynthesis glycosyltransferase TuaH
MKLAVLDANALWTERLFRECSTFADVLLLKPRDFRAHRRATGSLRSDPTSVQVGNRVWEQRFSMPIAWMFRLWPLAQRKLSSALRRFSGKETLALVVTYPQYRKLIHCLKPALSIYYNLDDYRDNWPRYKKCVSAWEAEMVEVTDLTVCIADHRVKILQEQHFAKRDQIHHLPLGCSPEFMECGARSKPATRPLALRDFNAPVAGYIGALNYRFDFGFLAEVADRLPEVTFLLGGQVQEDGNTAWRAGLQRARSAANVHFLGWIEHARLGDYLHAFDILLMPYTHCHFNTNACPAKLWDYLGTGKPIVANDANPETLLWSKVVRVGAKPEQFANAIRDALGEQGTALRQSRLEIARAHTWEQLSRRMERIIEDASAKSLHRNTEPC